MDSSSTPPNATPSSTFGWRTVLVGVVVVVIIGGTLLLLRGTPQIGVKSKTTSVDVFTQPAAASDQPLALQWHVVTAGPSPFNSNTWTARLELSATGGNGQYIFWLNNQRLPDTSPNQVTVDSSACDKVGQMVGVTSGGQAVSQALVVHSPLPNCAVP